MTSKGFGIGWLCACLLIAQAHAASSSVEANGHRLTVRRTALTVHTILLDGRRMFDDRTDELVTLLGPFSGDGATFVLLDEQPGGNACAGMLQAIDLTRMPPVVTPSFGNCNDQVAPFVSGGLLHVTTPPFTPGGLDKGTSPAESYTFGSGLLTKLTTAPAPVRSPNAGLHAVSPTGPRRLYYAGLNTIGPTIRGALVARIITWPPAFRVLLHDDFRGIRLGMTRADADSLARSHGMQPDEAGRHIWYDGLGPRPHEIFGQSALRVDCGPDARSEFGSMSFIKRQQYRSCLAFGPVEGDRSRVGSISSVQTLDPNATQASTLAALVGKYGPPSQQTASNELLWFAKDPSGETVAIDALFTDPYAEANQDRTAENSGTTGGPKLLDVEAEFFHLPPPPASAAPSAPQL